MKRPEWLKLSAKGPELKMPELKPPAFLVDLWWDLWDRRLLPIVALIVVAIAAVPFLMGGSKPVPQSSLAALAAASASPGAADNGTAKLAVVQEEPGLRDYHKRLERLVPTDPFKQRFAQPHVVAHLSVKGEGSGGSTTTTTTTTSKGGESSAGGEPSGSTAPEPAPGPPATQREPSGGAPSSGGSTKPHIVFYTFAINVRITRARQAAEGEAAPKPESWTRKKVLPLTPLPGKKAPVITYMGVSKQGKPLLLISNGASSLSGEGTCLSGEDPCQLLEVEPGFPVTLVYGPSEVRYTFKVLKVEFVVVKRT
ncbi:MAG TPA: hypothetical protein VFP23_02435 [Solirubrobacterales bacterium]|nr:hypothetical protein [Solirubrobacterales bacterium]